MGVEIVLVALSDRVKNFRLPSMFHRAGARVTLLGNPRSSIGWSRFVRRRIACSAGEIATSLRAMYSDDEKRPWVIFCDEESLAAVAHCRGEGWLEEVLPVDQYGAIFEAMLSRSAFLGALAESLPTLPFYLCRSANDAKAAGEMLRFPLRLMPDSKCDRSGPIEIKDANALTAICEKSFDSPKLVVQEIEGRPGFTDVLYHRGQAVGWSSWHTRPTPAPVLNLQLDAMVENIGRMTAFKGFAGFDWVEDPNTGRFFFLDFHARPTEGLSSARHNGVDFTRALYEMFQGILRVQRPRPMQRRGIGRWFPKLARQNIPWNDPAVLARSALGVLKAT